MDLIVLLPVLIFSVICHEVAHGWVALKFGDDTALNAGRLTLNPLPHIDPVGSVIFPGLCLLMNIPAFGWARPVPVNPDQFSAQRPGVICVSLAGPLTNFAIAAAFAFGLDFALGRGWAGGEHLQTQRFLTHAILLNLVLTVFNLIPIPPMDGSKIVASFLPRTLAARYDSVAPYGFLIVMVLIGFGILGKVLTPAVAFLYALLMKGFGIA